MTRAYCWAPRPSFSWLRPLPRSSPRGAAPASIRDAPSKSSDRMIISFLVRAAAWTLYASAAAAQPADSVVRQATRLFETGNTAAATALVRPLADSSATAATLLGRMAWQSANYKDAARWLDAAIALDPRHVEALV